MNKRTVDDVIRIADLSRFLDAVPAPFVVYDPDERIVACNAAYQSQYHPHEDVVMPGVTHTELQWLKANNGLDQNAIGRPEDFVRDEQERHRFGPETEEWRDDNGRYMRLLRARLPDGHVVGMRFDITDLRQAQKDLEERNASLREAQQELEHIASIDALTKLANRRGASEKLLDLQRICQEEDLALALMLIDLDGFKGVNDSLGHSAGDAVLVAVAARLKQLTNPTDLVARMGGDEFLIAMSSHCDKCAIEIQAQKIIDTLNEPIDHGGRKCRVGASVGVALDHRSFSQQSDLIRMADVALYKAKSSGRNKFQVFDGTLQLETAVEDQLSQDLLADTFANEITMYFQPIVCAQSGETVAAEALVRWQHPQLGLLAPDRFLDLVARQKMMNRLDHIVMCQVLEHVRAWQAAGIHPPKISVNVSADRLRDPELLSDLGCQMVPADPICFEILETVFTDENDPQLLWNLDGLRELGIEMQLDDYGTSHSSIAGLLTIRPSRIKIDRQFCSGVVDNPEAQDIVSFTVALASALGISVTAEGVETAEAADRLASLGCDRLQGYHFGRPVPADEFAAGLGPTNPERTASAK